MPERIGLIGIGLLGTAIAERLLDGGFAVYGFDVRDDLEAFLTLGGQACDTPADVAQQANRVVLCLPDSTIARQVVRALSPHLREHTVYDTTTGAPEDAEQMAAEVSQAGSQYLDVTVSGSSQQMRDHAATLLIGGSEVQFDAGQDLFRTLGVRMFHVGPVGSASRMKLVVNLAIGLHRAVLAEALEFGGSLGFEPEKVAEVLRHTPAYSAVMDTKADKMVNSEFAPQARLRQHAKDVKLILALAQASGAKVPLSRLHAELLEQLLAAGWGDADNSVIIKAFRPEGDL